MVRRVLTWLATAVCAAGTSVAIRAETGLLATSKMVFQEGPYTQTQCLECHTERDPSLITQWRVGPHGEMADCVSCHGEAHGDLPQVRSDTTCTGCHSGPIEHSYATSKHGVLVRLERPNWEFPLQRGRYRAPGCAYCHLHGGDHGDTMGTAREPLERQWICGGCHAPRYVRRMFESGERLVALGQLKLDEAQAIAERHPQGSEAVRNLLDKTVEHLRNLRLGAGHQSPDYQWWHGQPALDGDLIRIRDRVASERREKNLRNQKQ